MTCKLYSDFFVATILINNVTVYCDDSIALIKRTRGRNKYLLHNISLLTTKKYYLLYSSNLALTQMLWH